MILLAAFLVLSHVAMIFGMVDPGIAGYSPEKSVQVEKHLHHGIEFIMHEVLPPFPDVFEFWICIKCS